MTAEWDFALTDTCYAVWSRAATYTPVVGQPIDCTVVVNIEPQIAPEALEFGARSEDVTVRVKKQDVAAPERGATLIYDGNDHRVEGFDHNGETEWVFYVRP